MYGYCDQNPTDKPTFKSRLVLNLISFARNVQLVKTQQLLIFGFVAGQKGMGMDALSSLHPMLVFLPWVWQCFRE
jgi:hypothetical protein